MFALVIISIERGTVWRLVCARNMVVAIVRGIVSVAGPVGEQYATTMMIIIYNYGIKFNVFVGCCGPVCAAKLCGLRKCRERYWRRRFLSNPRVSVLRNIRIRVPIARIVCTETRGLVTRFYCTLSIIIIIIYWTYILYNVRTEGKRTPPS